MKIPITDKFLWDFYNFIEDLDKICKIGARRTLREAVNPGLFRRRLKWERKQDRRNFSKLIHYLKKRGLIKVRNLENKKAILLTPMGKERILKVKYKMMEKKPRKDGKLQMIIFDIPEKKRHFRDLLREHLITLGYKMLQKSIWICPYDVLKETEEFLRRYSLDPYVKLFLIEEL